MAWVGTKSGERAALQSAIITIGPSGEKKSRVGALIHDAGNAAAQGGFGGVWGAKNLKAISVIGPKDIDVADAAALLNARFSAREDRGVNVDEPKDGFGWARFSGNPSPAVMYPMPTDVGSRPQACQSCISSCRARFSDGLGNESSCEETYFYFFADMMYNQGQTTPTVRYSAEMVQRLGINVYEVDHGLNWLYHLYQEGIAGPGKQVDIDLPWDTYGSREFIETYQKMVADREGAGDILVEGMWRAAEHWGRLEEDTASGVLHYSYWGLPEHGYDPRAEAYWGWGSILGDRDINEHDFNNLFWKPSIAKWYGIPNWMEAEEFVTKFAERMLPFDPDPMMLDFSDDGMYSEGQVKLTAWHRHYTRFWKGIGALLRLPVRGLLQPQDRGSRRLHPRGRTALLERGHRRRHELHRRYGAWAAYLEPGQRDLVDPGPSPRHGQVLGVPLRGAVRRPPLRPVLDADLRRRDVGLPSRDRQGHRSRAHGRRQDDVLRTRRLGRINRMAYTRDPRRRRPRSCGRCSGSGRKAGW